MIICTCPDLQKVIGSNVPVESCVGSFRRLCSLSRSESSCFLWAWMLLHVSDMTDCSDGYNNTDTVDSERIMLFTDKHAS